MKEGEKEEGEEEGEGEGEEEGEGEGEGDDVWRYSIKVRGEKVCVFVNV